MPSFRPLEERFWEKVDVRESEECWPWIGSFQNTGYGQISAGGKNLYAHRISFEINNRVEIMDGAYILHSCDNKWCVNPSHLSEGDAMANIHQAIDRGRWTQIGDGHYSSVIDRKASAEVVSYLDAGESGRDIARRYGVAESVISEIKNNKHWTTRRNDD